jgi:hypothetical protein
MSPFGCDFVECGLSQTKLRMLAYNPILEISKELD